MAMASFAENMGKLFEQGLFTDCTIKAADGQEFKAHKGILACQSSVFWSMFEHQMVEAKEGIAKIEDIKPRVLEQMLIFFYNGKTPKLNEMAKELLETADEYDLARLKAICEYKLAKSINDANVCELLVLANRHSAEHLKNEALNYIQFHAEEVMKTDGWRILVRSNMGLFDQISEAIVDGLPNLFGDENVCELLVLANRHSVEHLKDYRFSNRHYAEYLKVEAINYIQWHAKKVTKTKGWKMLLKENNMELMDQIVKAIVKKKPIYAEKPQSKRSRILPSSFPYPDVFDMDQLNKIVNLFEKSLFTDCTIIASDGKKFRAHKGILACQSPVFRAMFEHQMIEAKEGIVKIKDIKSPVLEQMRKFMYSGKAPKLKEMTLELLESAGEYQLDPLKILCERELANSIRNENVCEMLVLADRYSSEHLKILSIDFIRIHAEEIMKSDGWKMMMKGNHMELMEQIMKALVEAK